MEEERKRLKALLDKLRIDAEVRVFALASGLLETYNAIINGARPNVELESHIDNILKGDGWWQELQRLRQQESSEQQGHQGLSFGEMLGRSRRRGSSPRIGDHLAAERRSSQGDRPVLPKNPTVSAISRMGVNIGMHTHQLGATTMSGQWQDAAHFYEPSEHGKDRNAIGGAEAYSDSSDADFNDDDDDLLGDDEPQVLLSGSAPARRRFSMLAGSRRNSTPLQQRPLLQGQTLVAESNETFESGIASGYGTMASRVRDDRIKTTEYFPPFLTPTTQTPAAGRQAAVSTPALPMQKAQPARPALSRHASSSRFTSNPTPDTKITANDGEQPTISFAGKETLTEETPAQLQQGRPPRPGLARTASAGNFSSGVVPELVALDSTGEEETRLGFGHVASNSQHHIRKSSTPRRRTPAHSRRNSGTLQLDGLPDEPEPEDLLSDVPGPRRERGTELNDVSSGTPGSSYTTQGLPLSFNDLPSTAQHLVLNELMRSESHDTAVMFTTLPIPEEGTCEDEQASLEYLSDIEVLCDELPPVMLVLSNNMTVTVSL